MLSHCSSKVLLPKFLTDKFTDVCENINRLKDSKDPIIRRSVIQTIPVLASFDPSEFSASYLNNFMLYMLAQIKKEKEKIVFFQAVGKISDVVGSNIVPYLDQIIGSIKDSIGSKG